MYKELVKKLWVAMDAQRWDELPSYFAPDAKIEWPNTNELFTVGGFVTANAQYPGKWKIAVLDLLEQDDRVASVVKVSLADEDTTLHATSWFTFHNGLIQKLVEYWADDGPAPQWRQEMNISRPIHVKEET